MSAYRVAADGGKLPTPERVQMTARGGTKSAPDCAMDAKLPLKALRAFDVAARHLSFTKAADELHVTTGAVSYQIKMLEDVLGVRLFHRSNNSLSLTAAGADFSRMCERASGCSIAPRSGWPHASTRRGWCLRFLPRSEAVGWRRASPASRDIGATSSWMSWRPTRRKT